jgi:hypothetical protein
VLLKFLVVGVKVPELVRKNVGVWDEVKVALTEFLLHTDHVVAQAVLPRNLIALWKVVNLLVLIQALVEVALAGRGAPEDVPLMRLRVRETVALEDRSKEFVIESQHLVEEL